MGDDKEISQKGENVGKKRGDMAEVYDEEEDDDLMDEEDEESSEDEVDENYNILEQIPDELIAYKEMMDIMLYKIRSNERVTKKLNDLSVDDLVSMIESKAEELKDNLPKKKKKSKKKKKEEKSVKFEEKIENSSVLKNKKKKKQISKVVKVNNLKEIKVNNGHQPKQRKKGKPGKQLTQLKT